MGTNNFKFLAGFFVLIIPIWADSDVNRGSGSVNGLLMQDFTSGNPILSSKVSVPEIFTQKTMSLLSEAVNTLGQANDAKSKQWLEAFVFKIGQLAVELEESSKNDDKLVIIPTNEEKVTIVKPAKQHSSMNAKASDKLEVTSPRVIDVLPANDQIQDHHVVTKPGIISNASEEEEDDLVRQLHEQNTDRSKKSQQIKVVLHHHVPSRNPHSHKDKGNDDYHTVLDEKEAKILVQVLKDMEKYSDRFNEGGFRNKGSNGIAGARESNSFQQQADITSETDDFINYANLDPHDLEFYLTSTASPLHDRTTNKPTLTINKNVIAKQASENDKLPLMEDSNFDDHRYYQQQRHSAENIYPTWFLPYLFQMERNPMPHSHSYSHNEDPLSSESKNINEKYHHMGQHSKNYRPHGKFAHANSHAASYPFERESFRHKLIRNHERWSQDQEKENSLKRRIHSPRKDPPQDISQVSTPYPRDQLISQYPKRRLQIPQAGYRLGNPEKNKDEDITKSVEKFDTELERELRAGKVVILSNNVVRANFTKRPNKDQGNEKPSNLVKPKQLKENAM